MQLEIDHLKRKLRYERKRRTPSISDFSSDGKEDGNYRRRSKTPPSESFSYDEDYHHERRNRSSSSKGEEDGSYRRRSRTPPSESFLYNEDYHHKRKNRNSSSRGLGNDAISRALNQISRSFFMCSIGEARLPWWFTQPTFTMYNGRTDPMEHVSHFNQRMVVHSKNEALMCKVFPSNLGPVAMRWFNGLEVGSIDSFKELT